MFFNGQTDLLPQLATAASQHWNADPAGITHIASSGNVVYLMLRSGETFILRLTDTEYRSRLDNETELRYIRHLHGHGIRIAAPVPSVRGHDVEEVNSGGVTALASVFRFAPGARVGPESPFWNRKLFREWGAMLGRIHNASRTFRVNEPTWRSHWLNEIFLDRARQLIPTRDHRSLRELEAVVEVLQSLPTGDDLFGMTHADFAPQNFHYDPQIGITVFDFGNCCRHWYVSDLAVSFTALRHLPERDYYRALILEGYREEYSIDPGLLDSLPWFIRLRTLYVYLSRLLKFGGQPTTKEQQILADLQRLVHEGAGRPPVID